MNTEPLHQANRIGIIDLGSNSARLVVYEVMPNGGYRPCYRMKRNTRLARYLDDHQQLRAAGTAQAVEDVRAFVRVGQLYQVTSWLAVATAAIRQATNGPDVLHTLEQQTQIPFRLLTGQEEAWYSYLGIVNTMNVTDAALVDVGGASIELMHVRDRKLIHSVSIPFGALTLTRRFAEFPASEQCARIEQFLAKKFQGVDFLADLSALPLIGTGGTARALGKIAQHLNGSEIDRFHGYEIEPKTLAQMYDRMKSVTIEERRRLGDLSDTRAEVIHAGVAAYYALVTNVRAPHMLVCGSGLREGLFYEYLLHAQDTPVLPSVRAHSTDNFMRVFGVQTVAAKRVAACAVYLFDQLQSLHGLPTQWRDLTHVAACIKQAGTFVNVEKSVRHTDYLIRSSYLYGFTQGELLDIGQLVLGKGSSVHRQLSGILDLAHILVYESGLSTEDLDVTVKAKKVILRVIHGSLLNSSLDAVQKTFSKHLGAKLTLIDPTAPPAK